MLIQLKKMAFFILVVCNIPVSPVLDTGDLWGVLVSQGAQTNAGGLTCVAVVVISWKISDVGGRKNELLSK